MSLRDYPWKGYYAGHEDLLNEFFIPALKHSTSYDRITGSFSASVLALFSEGLPEFIENGGTIRLMPGIELYEHDIEAIEQGRSGDVIKNHIEWEELKNGNRDEVMEALAWLVAEEILDIKIGVVTDDLGRLQTKQEAEWHQKVAIFGDDEGNIVGVSGSPNESFKALKQNRESFSLFRSWIEMEGEEWDEKTRLQEQIDEFNRLWNDEDPRSSVFDFPEALEQDLLEAAPTAEPDWDDIIPSNEQNKGQEDITLRPYQKDAIRRFLNNNNRIILDHATGTGKTWTSLLAMQRVVESDDVIVIFAPTRDLVNQWVDGDNIRRFFPKSNIIRCLGDVNWREDLHNQLFTNRSAPLFVVTTMHPTTMKDAIERINSECDPEQVGIIADEVHNLGSSLRRTIFPKLQADLGRVALSATPFRDDIGDDTIVEYFGSEIHEVSIQDAIEKYGVLSEYEYHIHPVVLSSRERQEYDSHSTEISNLYNTYKSYEDQPVIEVSDRHPDLKVEIMGRARIVKECEGKLSLTRSIIEDIGTRTLVYCNTEDHTKAVINAIDDHTTKTASIFLGKLSKNDKENLLNLFEKGDIEILVSIDCLTEGIDVPECDSAILVTSSTTEREAIQRRGRILREAQSDSPAQLHDFITLPAELESIKSGDADLTQAELSLIERELERLRMMNADATNRMDNDPYILRIARAMTQYDLE
jgi:superfamily II DNA or RNA helicase